MCTLSFAQKHDHVWLMGSNSQTNPNFMGITLDFNFSPVDVYSELRNMRFSQANASMCDTAGNLLFYTNGIYIANALHEPMENGMGLNPGASAVSQQEYGYILDQGAMALPVPERDSLYYLFHMDKELTSNQSSLQSYHFYYSLINMAQNEGLGKVISKNQVVIDDNLHKGKIVATKHANGRDWWALIRRYGTNEYYKISINPSGIFSGEIVVMGNPIPSNSIGQAVFSPDGSKYANVHVTGSAGNPIYLSIYDFDRCSGELSNPVQFTYADTASCGGIAISPNNRFLYVSSFKYVYQYDLEAQDIEASRITVAVWDGFTENNFFATTFYLAQLAPDGKIYINSNNSVSYLHVINHPDSLGLACDVCQHCVDLPSINSFSLPNFPNYRLGPLEGSPCDTLRQPPVAAWSHTALGPELAFRDESYHDIRRWAWSFGDGAIDTLPHPVHTYAQAGAYEACLSATNPRGTDTRCQTIQVTLTAVEEPAEGEAFSCALFPNPARGATTLRATGLPEAEAVFVLRDALGREVVRQVLAPVGGQLEQSLPLVGLPAGNYWYELWCGASVAKGKLGVLGER